MSEHDRMLGEVEGALDIITTLYPQAKEFAEKMKELAEEVVRLRKRVEELEADEKRVKGWYKRAYEAEQTLHDFYGGLPLIGLIKKLCKKLEIQRERGQLMLDWENDLLEAWRIFQNNRAHPSSSLLAWMDNDREELRGEIARLRKENEVLEAENFALAAVTCPLDKVVGDESGNVVCSRDDAALAVHDANHRRLSKVATEAINEVDRLRNRVEEQQARIDEMRIALDMDMKLREHYRKALEEIIKEYDNAFWDDDAVVERMVKIAKQALKGGSDGA